MSGTRLLFQIALIIFVAMAEAAHPSPPATEHLEESNAAKIKFRLDGINAEGLRGEPGSQGSVAYEFCVPANDRVYQEVRRIDPKVQFMPGSRGRIGCGKDQTLCVGRTNQPHWRDVLKGLCSLRYVTEIRECFFE